MDVLRNQTITQGMVVSTEDSRVNPNQNVALLALFDKDGNPIDLSDILTRLAAVEEFIEDFEE